MAELTASEKDKLFTELAGRIFMLLLESPSHHDLTIGNMTQRLIPALVRNQYNMFVGDGKPVAFISWARVSEDIISRISAGGPELAMDEWKSGEFVWIVDAIFPLGDTRAFLHDAKNDLFPNERVRMFERSSSGETLDKVVDL